MGSSPAGRANAVPTRVSAIEGPSRPAQKANAHPLSETIEAFLLTKRVAGGLQGDPLRGFAMRGPKTPDVPTDDEPRDVVAACRDTFEGVRDRKAGAIERLRLE